MQGSATNYTYGNRKGKRAQIDLPSRITPPRSCVVPTQHSVSGKGVTNLRTINLLAYIILNNYLENISLQKKKSYTPIVEVITMSCTYILSLIYLYFYIYIVSKILHLHSQNLVKPTCGGILQLCWPCCIRNIMDVFFGTYTDKHPC